MGKHNLDDVFFELKPILNSNSIDARGIVHVGAHKGQEVKIYKEAGFKDILLIEPMPEYAANLRKEGYEVIEAAITDSKGSTELYITDYDQASSALKPIEHSVNSTIAVKTMPLRDAVDKRFNCLVVDAQGSELAVLKSGNLNQFDLVIYEASETPRYENAASRNEMSIYMKSQGFRLLKSFQHGPHDIYDEVFIRDKDASPLVTLLGRLKKAMQQ